MRTFIIKEMEGKKKKSRMGERRERKEPQIGGTEQTGICLLPQGDSRKWERVGRVSS